MALLAWQLGALVCGAGFSAISRSLGREHWPELYFYVHSTAVGLFYLVLAIKYFAGEWPPSPGGEEAGKTQTLETHFRTDRLFRATAMAAEVMLGAVLSFAFMYIVVHLIVEFMMYVAGIGLLFKSV